MPDPAPTTDPNPQAPPVTDPPAPTTPPAEPPAPTTDNEAAKFRRLHERAERELAEARAELKKRQDAELSEAERLKREAEEAKAERDKLRQDLLRQRIAAEAKLDADLAEFLTGTDEEALRAQAAKLAGKLATPGAPAAPAAPVQGGTTTQPARGAQPSIDERIAAAQKAGNTLETIRLKREKAFGPG